MQVRNNSVSFNPVMDTQKVVPNSNSTMSFEETYKQNQKQEIDVYIDKIKNIGTQIISTQNYSDVVNYKKAIKEYLKEIVDYAYSLNKNTSFWESQYYTTVETINAKLEDLTKSVLSEQKYNIDIASSIEGIQGLIIDIYI